MFHIRYQLSLVWIHQVALFHQRYRRDALLWLLRIKVVRVNAQRLLRSLHLPQLIFGGFKRCTESCQRSNLLIEDCPHRNGLVTRHVLGGCLITLHLHFHPDLHWFARALGHQEVVHDSVSVAAAWSARWPLVSSFSYSFGCVKCHGRNRLLHNKLMRAEQLDLRLSHLQLLILLRGTRDTCGDLFGEQIFPLTRVHPYMLT